MKIFKIKLNPLRVAIAQGDGPFFSTGGSWPRASMKGKTWKSMAHVKSHLSLLSRDVLGGLYFGATIVEYEVVENYVAELDVRNVVVLIAEERTKKKQKAELAAAKYAREYAERKLKEATANLERLNAIQ